MSLAEVPVVKVELRNHPTADTLSLVSVYGYQVCVKTEEFRGVSLGVFIPPDYIVPATEQWAYLGSARRIKCRKYRGERSEGVLIPASPHHKLGDNVMEELGIVKWESPADRAERCMSKKPRSVFKWWSPRSWLHWLRIRRNKMESIKAAPPGNVKVYDIESARRFPVLNDGEVVVVTEKIHGCNARYVYSSKTQRLHVGSHTCWKRRGAVDWWNGALDQNAWIERVCKANPDCVFYGEIYGRSIQSLDYGILPGEYGFKLFDIYEPSTGWASWDRLTQFFFRDSDIQSNWVPIVYTGVWRKEIETIAEGKTKISSDKAFKHGRHIREGVVVEPWVPRTAPGIGRVKVKYINPAYLEIKDAEQPKEA